jgi:hypothetical protein
MIIKQKNNYKFYLKVGLVIALLVLVFVFKSFFTNFFINIKEKYFYIDRTVAPTTAELEELSYLRVQNQLQREELQLVREEFSMNYPEENVSPVYLLLARSTIYGDFYVTLPKDKTAYKDMNIFSTGNIVVGQVAEVLSNSLRIEPLGQDKSFIGTSLEGDESVELKSQSLGLYTGNISGGSKIALGDSIVLKGYPKAIVGVVVEISEDQSALSTIYVRTPYSLQTKEIFYVLQ